MTHTPKNLFTTFSEQGYTQYGKRWIDSVIKHWPKDTSVRIYVDFDLEKPADNFEILDFNKIFPNHKEFKKRIKKHFDRNDQKGPMIGKKTIKFSYKAFVIQHELKNNVEGYSIWTDADTETIKFVDIDFGKLIGSNNFMACQMEKINERRGHVESGILFIDNTHEKTKNFARRLETFYNTRELFDIKKPYDGYVIAEILKMYNYPYKDLNDGFDIENKRSDKDETFLHPTLQEYFVHWIGTRKN